MTPLVSLSRALIDPALFGGTFAAPSFWTWRTLAKVIDGIALTEPREIELFKECTGRTRLLSTSALTPVRRIIVLVGRRGGKDRFLSAVAIWRAALCADWRKYISAGEQAVVILLGADKKQAAILRRYCEGLLQTPLLRQEVTRSTGEVTEFRNGASLEIATNDARLVRGRSAIAVLGSEASHWKTDEYAASSDEEVVGAAEPSLSMCPDGGLLLLGSSVHRRRGFMYRKYRQLHGNDDAEDICWFAPSTTMNPRLPASVVDKALAEDAPRARAEYCNFFREDISDFVPVDVIEACTDFGVRERAPVVSGAVKYVAFCDAAGGTGRDSFTLAIAHREINSRNRSVVLDVVYERRPRFVPAAVVAEFAAILRLFKITEVQGDGFAGGFHADEWANHQIKFVACERTTSENYLALLPLMLQPGRVRLCDSAVLRQQLAGLERRVHAGVRESVSHAQTQSAHDDVAASAAGAIVLAASRSAYNLFAPGLFDDEPQEPTWAERERQRHYDELLARYGQPVTLNPIMPEHPEHVREGIMRAKADALRRRNDPPNEGDVP
jgi:hypothetical protein